MTRDLHPVAAQYLERLERAARRLPRGRRRELVAEIEAHLAEAVPPGVSDADALNALERVGEPEEVVRAESPHPPGATSSRGPHEWAAILLLLFGGFLAGVGWIAGVVLLWSSRAWTTREKWIGTLVVPGGLAAALWVLAFGALEAVEGCSGVEGGATECTGGASTGEEILFLALLAVCILAPIFTALFLARRADTGSPAGGAVRPVAG